MFCFIGITDPFISLIQNAVGIFKKLSRGKGLTKTDEDACQHHLQLLIQGRDWKTEAGDDVWNWRSVKDKMMRMEKEE